jgi:glycosyltransferase involved in cell wall biosynthesis
MVSKKIRVAFIKYGGLAAGGTERWLQMMAANLPKDEYQVDYYYCEARPYYNNSDADAHLDRVRYMQERGIRLIRFDVRKILMDKLTYPWIETDFWQKFDASKYDIIQTAKAGSKEYPYYLIDLPVVEFIVLDAGADFSRNIAYSIHPSAWQRDRWLKKGGNPYKNTVIPVPVDEPSTAANFRDELGISRDALVAGFHQRNSDVIFSDIPLRAFSEIYRDDCHFVILGGSQLYREQAKRLGLFRVHFIDHSADAVVISKFLNTLDIFAHGRKDGETFGTVFAEAMIHGLPCLSHHSSTGSNAHKETMGPCGLWALDQQEYTAHLSRLFADKDLRFTLSAPARDFARKNYSLQDCIEELKDVYQKVLLREPYSFSEKAYRVLRNFYIDKRKVRAIVRKWRKT